MARIILNNQEYGLLDFDNEAEFEKAVIENRQYLFGKDSAYLDIKKLIGHDKHRGIPDAFLIDFFDPKKPQLYLVENELARHDIYSHITEQIARFNTGAITSTNQIRTLLISAIEANPEISKQVDKNLAQTTFRNLTELILYLVEGEIKVVLAINEISADLNLALKIFKNPPDTVLLQRYRSGGNISYYYEPMRDEVEDIDTQKRKSVDAVEFDTVVCAAYPDGFKDAYLDKSAWWAIRLSQAAREQLKYLAIYEKSPVAHISHYAEIDRIEPYKDSGKYIVYLKNKKTIKPIKLGQARHGDAPQSPRYTTLEHLLKAKKITDLWYWR